MDMVRGKLDSDLRRARGVLSRLRRELEWGRRIALGVGVVVGSVVRVAVFLAVHAFLDAQFAWAPGVGAVVCSGLSGGITMACLGLPSAMIVDHVRDSVDEGKSEAPFLEVGPDDSSRGYKVVNSIWLYGLLPSLIVGAVCKRHVVRALGEASGELSSICSSASTGYGRLAAKAALSWSGVDRPLVDDSTGRSRVVSVSEAIKRLDGLSTIPLAVDGSPGERQGERAGATVGYNPPMSVLRRLRALLPGWLLAPVDDGRWAGEVMDLPDKTAESDEILDEWVEATDPYAKAIACADDGDRLVGDTGDLDVDVKQAVVSDYKEAIKPVVERCEAMLRDADDESARDSVALEASWARDRSRRSAVLLRALADAKMSASIVSGDDYRLLAARSKLEAMEAEKRSSEATGGLRVASRQSR